MNAMLLIKDLAEMILENDSDNTQLCFQIKDRYYFSYEMDWEADFTPNDEDVIVVRLG